MAAQDAQQRSVGVVGAAERQPVLPTVSYKNI